MKEHLTLLRERLAKAEAREARAKKTLETAKIETSDLQTALRVMSELAGESSPSPLTSGGDRQKAILRLLPIGEASPKSPAELFEAYSLIADEVINIDTFRTTVWRMRDKAYHDEWGVWLVKGDTGNYWKEPASISARTVAELGSNIPDKTGDDELKGDERLHPNSNWGGPTGRSDNPFDEDPDDSDIPF